MQIVTMHDDDSLRLGVLVEERVLDVRRAAQTLARQVPDTPARFYAAGLDAIAPLTALVERVDWEATYVLHIQDVRLGPPVPNPGKILCVGLNYRKHAAESNMAEPAQPVLFSKFTNAIAGPNDKVSIAGLEQVDYEAELALVIGRRTRNIGVTEAMGCVLGYCIANDLSDRQLQFVSGQWLLGKSLDGFLPMGPYVATYDEIAQPQSLAIRGWLNGELRQSSNTSDMVFSVAEIISYVSRYMTLLPGDVICTGTPEGVILGRAEKVWMAPGDAYAVEITGLGRLETTVVS